MTPNNHTGIEADQPRNSNDMTYRTPLPTIDRNKRHIRTPDGDIIPFAVIQLGIAALTIITAARLALGVTWWLIIPAALWIAVHLGTEISAATYHHRRTQPIGIDREDNA